MLFEGGRFRVVGLVLVCCYHLLVFGIRRSTHHFLLVLYRLQLLLQIGVLHLLDSLNVFLYRALMVRRVLRRRGQRGVQIPRLRMAFGGFDRLGRGPVQSATQPLASDLILSFTHWLLRLISWLLFL